MQQLGQARHHPNNVVEHEEVEHELALADDVGEHARDVVVVAVRLELADERRPYLAEARDGLGAREPARAGQLHEPERFDLELLLELPKSLGALGRPGVVVDDVVEYLVEPLRGGVVVERVLARERLAVGDAVDGDQVGDDVPHELHAPGVIARHRAGAVRAEAGDLLDGDLLVLEERHDGLGEAEARGISHVGEAPVDGLEGAVAQQP